MEKIQEPHLTKLGKLTIYYSFIMSNFNYCPLVWHFCGETNTPYSFILSNLNYCSITWHFCSEKNTLKMEKIQERALRFVYGIT
jgi:hypothetical protein